MRITRHQMFMEIARAASKRSTCLRLNVGAVVVRDHRPLSLGYNGQLPGASHCDSPCPAGGCRTIHAEVNALRHLPRSTLGPLKLYVTASPCPHCASYIIKDGRVAQVYYENEYRDPSALTTLEDHSVTVLRVLPSGLVTRRGEVFESA